MSRSNPVNINPDTDMPEEKFREKVREALDLDWSTRDERIFEELRRLKNLADMYVGK